MPTPHSTELKATCLKEAKAGTPVHVIAKNHKILPGAVYRWIRAEKKTRNKRPKITEFVKASEATIRIDYKGFSIFVPPDQLQAILDILKS